MAFLAVKCPVSISSEYGNTYNIVNVTNDDEAVVQLQETTTDIVVGDFVLFGSSINGIYQLEDQGCRVKSKTGNLLTMENLNSNDMDEYISGGTLKRVSTFTPFTTLQNLNFQEPQPNRVSSQTIHRDTATELFGIAAAPAISCNSETNPFDAAIIEVRKGSKDKQPRLITAEFPGGLTLAFSALVTGGRGISAEAGAIATSTIEFALKGEEIWYQD